MSTLVENVAKVTAAHAALKTAIAAKGVAVPEGTKLSGMPALVEQIQTGGATEPTVSRAVFAYDGAGTLLVPPTVVVDMTAATNLSYCFYYCREVSYLSLPAGFGQAATNLSCCFYFCDGLRSLSLPAGFGQAATNLSYCFYHCYGVRALTLPAGFGQNATDIGHCFDECAYLTRLSLPDGFGQNATSLYFCFRNCTGLASLTLPAGCGKNATSIGSCFSSCPALTSLHLPAGFGQVATGLYNCFYGCAALTTITGNPNFVASLSLSPCPNLTHDSLMVVINGLQTVSTTQTLTLGTTNLAKLTDEEKKVATDKGWTLA